MLGLSATELGRNHCASEVWILTLSLERSPIARIAGEVDISPDRDVEAHLPGLFADEGTMRERNLRVPAGRHCNRGRQFRPPAVLLPRTPSGHAHSGSGELEVGDSEAMPPNDEATRSLVAPRHSPPDSHLLPHIHLSFA